jgi:hypothetical protein
MHSARPSIGGSVRAQSSSGCVETTTKTVTLGRFFGAEFGNRDANPDRRSRRLPHHPSATGYGHP